MVKSQSAPNEVLEVEWPGQIEEKYIVDVRNRLDVIEQAAVGQYGDDHHMICCYLAAHDNRARDAVEALKRTVSWRKGRQMFWNHYRSQNERFQFLAQLRRVGTGHASTFGRAKDGRLVFYELIGENFSLPLHKEFSVDEFRDHIVVWAENLLSAALANSGRETHQISEIPYYEHELADRKEPDADTAADTSANSSPSKPSINEEVDSPDAVESDETSEAPSSASNSTVKQRFPKLAVSNQSKFCDVVGIVDWAGASADDILANKHLLVAADELLCAHYPHLVHRLYHVNMPLDFDAIDSVLRPLMNAQSLKKSIFLESSQTKERRAAFMKTHARSMRKKASLRSSRRKKKPEKEPERPSTVTNPDGLEEYARDELASQISTAALPERYGGEAKESDVFSFVDPLFRSLVGMSSEADPKGFEAYTKNERGDWTQKALRSSERHTERIAVQRGQHFKWQFTAEHERSLFFGVTFEADGFRGKSIKIEVRAEEETQCGFCPQFGDFIVLKDGSLVFQFRNVKGGRRLNLQYKIESQRFPDAFIRKHLPDYSAEERLLQSNTLNVGGAGHRHKRSTKKRTKTPSEYSGSTAMSSSPPAVNGKATLSTRSLGVETGNVDGADGADGDGGDDERDARRKMKKRSKSTRNKKSTKTSKKAKKKSKSTRAKTPEPQTPHTPADDAF